MPFKSQAQRALFNAVAQGRAKGRPGISKKTAKAMVADDPGGSLPKRIKSSINDGIRKANRKKQKKG